MSDEKEPATPTDYDSMWGEAFNEQPAESASETADEAFKKLEDEGTAGKNTRELRMIGAIPVKVTVELGSTQLPISRLLELSQGSVVELNSVVGEPMRMMINGHPVAKGEVVVNDGKFAVRVTEIIDAPERLSSQILPS